MNQWSMYNVKIKLGIKNWPDPSSAVPSRMYLSNKAVNLPLSMGSVNKMFSFVDDAK